MAGIREPRCIPQFPAFETESERMVWELLCARGNPEWAIIANRRLTDATKDHEADLIVVMPDVGVVVLEVKGGSVSIDTSGTWRTTSGAGTRIIDPVNQARTTKYALWEYVKADPRWRGRTRVRFGHAVVVPYTHVDADFSMPECPRWLITGRDELDDLPGRLWDVAAQQESGFRVPTEEDCGLIVDILAGRGLPQRDVLAIAQERADRADRLTHEQDLILKVTRLLNRVEVRGGAGSGKTVLALTQAKDLTRGRDGRRPQRVALICYSIGLGMWFTRVLAKVGHREKPAFIGTFEELGRYLGVTEFGSRDDPDFWEVRLPSQMSELAEQLDRTKAFDAIIVDEAQDFADLWWRPLLGCLRDEETGGVYAYSDENQRVFARFGAPPVPLVPLVLDHNLRNTRQIADTFASLTPMRMRALGGEGADVELVALPDDATSDEVLEAGDDVVDRLLDEGWRPEDIALMTTGSRHAEQVNQQDLLGQDGYWESFWDRDQVFYGHVLGCKGLERKAVVLCVNNHAVHERSKEQLYVGLSRATDLLVVVGVPLLIAEMGGREVARRLGI